MTTIPFHYRDDKAETPCDSSYTEGWVEGQVCPRGCDGSRTHYANDGHAECEEQPERRRGVSTEDRPTDWGNLL